MWETWNTALSLHGQDWISQHVYAVPFSRTRNPNLNEEDSRRYDPPSCPEMRLRSKSCPSHPRPQCWCSFSIPILLHGDTCTTGDEESASSHKHGGMGKPWPSIAASSCCVGLLLLLLLLCLPGHPYTNATCLSSVLGREVVNLSSAQITESIQEHLPWFKDFSWCIFVFLWNKSILYLGGLFPKTIKKEVFQRKKKKA